MWNVVPISAWHVQAARMSTQVYSAYRKTVWEASTAASTLQASRQVYRARTRERCAMHGQGTLHGARGHAAKANTGSGGLPLQCSWAPNKVWWGQQWPLPAPTCRPPPQATFVHPRPHPTQAAATFPPLGPTPLCIAHQQTVCLLQMQSDEVLHA